MATKSYSIVVTPDIAKEYLAKVPEYQRKLKKETVEQYTRLMQANKWLPGTVLQVSNGKLIDGQHRLHALIEADKVISFVVVEHSDENDVTRYEFTDQQDPRRIGDIMRVDAMFTDWKITLTDKVKLSGAAQILASDFLRKPIKLSNAEKIEVVRQWQEEFIIYKQIYDLNRDHYFLAAPYMSVALMTLRCQPKKAQEFWRGVITGETESMEMPYAKLRQFIMDFKRYKMVSNGGQLQVIRISATVYCWNAFFENRKIKTLRVPEWNINSRIAGTPF